MQVKVLGGKKKMRCVLGTEQSHRGRRVETEEESSLRGSWKVVLGHRIQHQRWSSGGVPQEQQVSSKGCWSGNDSIRPVLSSDDAGCWHMEWAGRSQSGRRDRGEATAHEGEGSEGSVMALKILGIHGVREHWRWGGLAG